MIEIEWTSFWLGAAAGLAGLALALLAPAGWRAWRESREPAPLAAYLRGERADPARVGTETAYPLAGRPYVR